MSDITTVSEGGITVSSNSETPEQISAILSDSPEPEKSDTSEAASILGKEGGKASAEARKAKETETPEPTEDEEIAEAEKLEKEGKLGKPRHDPRAAMLDKARKLAATKRELEQERAERARISAEIAEMRRAKPSEPKEAQKPATDDDPEPQEADFENYADYVKSASRWGARQEFSQQRQKAQERAKEDARGQHILGAIDSFTGRIAKAAEADAGFLERTAELAKVLQPSFMRPKGEALQPKHVISDRIIKSEKNVELMEHFAKNRSELQRIANAGTIEDILYEMAKVEAGFSAAPQAPARPAVSRANAPIRPVASSSHISDEMPGPEAPYEAHRAYWNQKDRAASRR